MNLEQFIELEKQKDYFIALNNYLDVLRKQFNVFPVKDEVFAAFNYVNNDCKVVILGQDPYYKKGMANGLAFSVNEGVAIPRSLHTIYKEIENEYGYQMSKTSGNLVSWAKQGVLLLNTCLTVIENQPLSCKNKGWEKFSDAIITYLNNDNTPKVFLLWGNEAIKKTKLLTNPIHKVLCSVHPSPMGGGSKRFLGNNHFKLTNEFLIENNKKPIDWKI